MGGDTKSGRGASGRFLLRLDPGLHARLRGEARKRGRSLNRFCVEGLAALLAEASPVPGIEPVVRRAVALFGDHLVAVAVYGSFARGEARAGSDVDILVVVEPSVSLVRRMYDSWDEEPATVDGLAAEPHFAHLPGEDDVAGGLWGEVALDGIVLHDPHLLLSRSLVRIRHDIVAGRLVRRTSHGQPYWVRGAA
jgi:predicted nucleotidyltransferase